MAILVIFNILKFESIVNHFMSTNPALSVI